MELVWAVLPFVAFLACPLMIVFCVFGMRKMGCAAPPATEAQVASQLPVERVAALRQQLRAIEAELATLPLAEAQASQADATGSGNRLDDIVAGTAHAVRRSA